MAQPKDFHPSRRNFIAGVAGASALASLPLKEAFAQTEPPGTVSNDIVKGDDTRKFLNGFGADPWASTPEEAQARLNKDIKDWAEYVRVAKIEKQ